jgi:hypothetical protein
MNENMAHAFHQAPWNVRKICADRGWNVTRGLANDQEVSNDGIDCSLVALEFLECTL